MMAMPSNCLFSALGLWWRHRGRCYIAFKRSEGKRGRILHAVAFVRRGDALYQLEYAPSHGSRKESITQAGAFPVLFDGWHYVTRWRLDGEGAGNTVDAAVAMLVRR